MIKIPGKPFNDRTNLFLLALNILFICYYGILALYSRPHYDDLHFMWKLKEMSISQYVSDMYFSRSGRFMAYILNGVIYKTILFLGEYRFFPVLFWSAGAGMCWIFARSIFKSIPSLFLLNTVLVFYNLFVLTNIDFAVFNWLCAMSYYLLAPMLLYTIYLINKMKIRWFEWIAFFSLCLFLGGGQETFTPVVLIVLSLNGIYYFKKNGYKISETFKDSRVRKICLAFILMLLCLIIVVIAPGNYARLTMDEFVSPNSITGFVIAFAKAIVTFIYFQAFYIPYYLILVILFVYIGRLYHKGGKEISLSYKYIGWTSFLGYIIYLVISVFPNVYLWSGFGVQRNYTHVVFFTMVFICTQAFLFGYIKAKDLWLKNITMLLHSGVFILCIIMIFNLYSDTISARKYALSVDNRIATLQEMNKNGVTGIVTVNPVSIPYTTDPKYLLFKLLGKKSNPQPLLYYVSDTDFKPNEYAFHLQKVYGFNFLIQLKQQ